MSDIPIYCLVDRNRLNPDVLPGGTQGRYLVARENEHFPPNPLEIHFASDSLDESLAHRDAMNRQSFDLYVRGKPFDRYMTTYHTAIREEDARRLCVADHMDWSHVTVTRGLVIVHNDRDFALWSDGLFTRPVSGVPSGGSLSVDAVTLIRRLYRADWGMVEGGPGSLARISRVVKTEVIPFESSRTKKGRHLFEKIDITWTDGQSGTLYAHTTGQFEGYLYEVFQTLDGLKKAAGIVEDSSPA